MLIKSYQDVPPTSYQGVPEGVQIREMITTRDGAPTFAMRVHAGGRTLEPQVGQGGRIGGHGRRLAHAKHARTVLPVHEMGWRVV